MEEITETMEIENSGYENFEDQFKYKSVTLENERKAKIYGRITIIFCTLGYSLLIIAILLGNIFMHCPECTQIVEFAGDYLYIPMIVCFGLTTLFGIAAQRKKKNEFIKNILLGMMGLFVFVPFVVIVAAMFFLMLTGQL